MAGSKRRGQADTKSIDGDTEHGMTPNAVDSKGSRTRSSLDRALVTNVHPLASRRGPFGVHATGA